MHAIIGAGDTLSPKNQLAQFSTQSSESKAMITIAGQFMIQWVLDALAQSDQVEAVVIVGLSSEYQLKCGHKPIHYVPKSQSYFENAVKIAQGRDLMRQGAPVGDERLALFNELLELRASCRIMASIVDSRRYGEIVPIVMPDQ